MLGTERWKTLDGLDYYRKFADRIQTVKSSLMGLLDDLRKDGKTIVGYAAAAKANTLMQYCGLRVNHTRKTRHL